MEENVLSPLFLSLCSSFKQILGLKKHFFLTSSFFFYYYYYYQFALFLVSGLFIYLFIAVSYFSGLEFFVQFYQKEKKNAYLSCSPLVSLQDLVQHWNVDWQCPFSGNCLSFWNQQWVGQFSEVHRHHSRPWFE